MLSEVFVVTQWFPMLVFPSSWSASSSSGETLEERRQFFFDLGNDISGELRLVALIPIRGSATLNFLRAIPIRGS
jgi:hypothetical protein